jgi:hypothetical protein
MLLEPAYKIRTRAHRTTVNTMHTVSETLTVSDVQKCVLLRFAMVTLLLVASCSYQALQRSNTAATSITNIKQAHTKLLH